MFIYNEVNIHRKLFKNTIHTILLNNNNILNGVK